MAFAQNDNITMFGEKRRQRVRMRGGQTKVETKPSSMKKRQIQNKSYEGNDYSFLCFFAQMVFWRQP